MRAAQQPNPRGSGTATIDRTGGNQTISDGTTSRAATRRTTGVRTTVPTVGAVSARAARANIVRSARTGTPQTVARSATNATVARSATVPANASRAAMTRATAVFDDMSVMGTGYTNCREAYNTCMDQFCAKSNDTYRRCFCSEQITEFRNTEAALNSAKNLLLRFEDNELNAIDKTAAEVNAMYSATVGEAAIKRDPSAAQSALTEIADLLSGKKTVQADPLNAMELDLGIDFDDIWSGNSSVISMFNNANQDLTAREGMDLYNAANRQCNDVVAGACENTATSTMVRNAYGVLINQDCNIYAKKIDAQREAVVETVRLAEKYLREARLDEYRAHNSADVNECVTRVKEVMMTDAACGTDYARCLDYTGQYINQTTGEPIYSPMLFRLTQGTSRLLNLENANGDPAATNPRFNAFLDSKRIYAESALDTCRDNADLVWNEFKRTALIEIAQAQDEKIEQVKATCVSTMGECYNSQSGQLNAFDTTNAQATGALNAYVTRNMCSEKVAACAALYAGPTDVPCQFDGQGRLTTPGCGMSALLAFVSTVDNIKVAEGCATGMDNFIASNCAPASGDRTHTAPYGCRLRSQEGIEEMLQDWTMQNCTEPGAARPTNFDTFVSGNPTIGPMIENAVQKIIEDIEYALAVECENAMGLWLPADDDEIDAGNNKAEQAFYTAAFGGRAPATIPLSPPDNSIGTTWGYCVQNNVRYQCMIQDESTGGKGYATFNPTANTCEFTTEWYQIRCDSLNGYYTNGMCYILD